MAANNTNSGLTGLFTATGKKDVKAKAKSLFSSYPWLLPLLVVAAIYLLVRK